MPKYVKKKFSENTQKQIDHFSSASDIIQRATQAWTSNKSIWTLSLFTGALLTGEQLQLKSNNLVNLCQHSLVLSAIRTRPCNLQITLLCCFGASTVSSCHWENEMFVYRNQTKQAKAKDFTNYIQPLRCTYPTWEGKKTALRSRH